MDSVLLNTIARELPVVAAFLVLIGFVLSWLAKFVTKRDDQWQEFLNQLDKSRGERETEWRHFLEAQQTQAATLQKEYHDQTTLALEDVVRNLKLLAGKQEKFGDMLIEHDKKLDLAVTEMRARVAKSGAP